MKKNGEQDFTFSIDVLTSHGDYEIRGEDREQSLQKKVYGGLRNFPMMQ